MYRIRADLNLKDIIGSEIHQICVGRYDVQFLFGSGRRICLQSEAEVLKDNQVVSAWDEESGWSSTAFFGLLNVVIEGYAVLSETMLEIIFEGGFALRLYDTSDQYESMQIYPEGFIV